MVPKYYCILHLVTSCHLKLRKHDSVDFGDLDTQWYHTALSTSNKYEENRHDERSHSKSTQWNKVMRFHAQNSCPITLQHCPSIERLKDFLL